MKLSLISVKSYSLLEISNIHSLRPLTHKGHSFTAQGNIVLKCIRLFIPLILFSVILVYLLTKRKITHGLALLRRGSLDALLSALDVNDELL